MRYALLAASLLASCLLGCNTTPNLSGPSAPRVNTSTSNVTRTPSSPSSVNLPSSDNGGNSSSSSNDSSSGSGTAGSGSGSTANGSVSSGSDSSGTGSGTPDATDSGGDTGNGYNGPEPTRGEMSSSTYRLEQFERKVKNMRGQPFRLGFHEKEAQKRVEQLAEKYPGHPAVMALVDRLHACLRASKGNKIEVTPEMLAYREREGEIIETLSQQAVDEWDELRQELVTDGAIAEAFPALNPEDEPEADVGRVVIVEKALRHPYNMFGSLGEAWYFMGDVQRGFWFFEAQSREFLAVYNAIKRYRQRVTQDVPQPWTLVGRIVEPTLLVPEAGDDPMMDAQPGWVLEPMALYVPGRALAVLQDDGTATFAGEDTLDEVLASQYSVTSIADDADPGEVVTTYIAALKEKNWELFQQLCHPKLSVTPMAREGLRHSWQRSQEGFAERYVHAEVSRVDPPNRGEVVVWVDVYDETGTAARSSAPIRLRQDDDGQWRLYSGLSF